MTEGDPDVSRTVPDQSVVPRQRIQTAPLQIAAPPPQLDGAPREPARASGMAADVATQPAATGSDALTSSMPPRVIGEFLQQPSATLLR